MTKTARFTDAATQGRHNAVTPARPSNAASGGPEGILSASLPPEYAPRLSAARTTAIRLPQTKTELPKYGASTRLPTISSPINAAPEKKAISFNIPHQTFAAR